MAVAFGVGQTASHFVDAANSYGAWPMVVPMALAALTLFAISWFWLPKTYRAAQ
jgi:DHA1 family bicyclomycin/chloramphenicol resistance-like MFS transporter